MSIGDICDRDVVVAEREMTIFDAALLMKQADVATLVVTQENDGVLEAVGILGRDDIISKVVAAALDPRQVTLAHIMNPFIGRVNETASVFEAMQLMHDQDLRQVVVIDSSETVAGILTSHKLFQQMAAEFIDFSTLVEQRGPLQDVKGSNAEH
jgi:predicted transcriptional regulator